MGRTNYFLGADPMEFRCEQHFNAPIGRMLSALGDPAYLWSGHQEPQLRDIANLDERRRG